MAGALEAPLGAAQPQFADLNSQYEYDMPGANRSATAAAVFATFEQVCNKNICEGSHDAQVEEHYQRQENNWEEQQACPCDEHGEGAAFSEDQTSFPSASSTAECPPEQGPQEQDSAKKRSRSCQERLNTLSKPRAAPELPELPPGVPEKRPEKKKQETRPSLLLRVKPINVDEAMEEFFASGCTVAPRFKYNHSDEYVTRHFQANSAVDFEVLPQANRILQKVLDEYGGPEGFNHRLYGDDKITVDELKDAVAQYLKDLNIDDKVDIHVREGMLSAANVCKPGADEKYVVNISNQPISRNMVQGICDHEVGTHLLRMMNDEHQVWHGNRDRYKLINPWTTEEGFATLNTYLSMTCKLLYPQALRYWAVCKGAQTGFSELFQDLEAHVPDKVKRFRMCCRIKRGMIDTSLPGAFYIDQAYFKGAVDLLRHLDEIDFGRLYCGQVALEDLDKIHFVTRKEVVRLPKFLNSYDKLKSFKAHCRALIKENEIVLSEDRVCKQVFVRNAKEFFKKPKKEFKLCTTNVSVAPPDPSRTIDLAYLENLSKPREPRSASVPAGPVEKTSLQGKTLDVGRLLDLAMPKKQIPEEPVPVPPIAPAPVRRRVPRARRDTSKSEEAEGGEIVNSGETQDVLHQDGDSADEAGAVSAPANPVDETLRRSVDYVRIRDLSRPRSPKLREEVAPVAQTPARPLDLTRIAALASPRLEISPPEPELPPKKPKRKRKSSKNRILAMVQGQRAQENYQDSGSEAEEEEAEDPSSRHRSSPSTCRPRSSGRLTPRNSRHAAGERQREGAPGRPPLPMSLASVEFDSFSCEKPASREKDGTTKPRSQSQGAPPEGPGTRRLRAVVAATRVSQRMAAAEEASRQRGSMACRQAAAQPPGELFKVVPIQTLQLCF